MSTKFSVSLFEGEAWKHTEGTGWHVDIVAFRVGRTEGSLFGVTWRGDWTPKMLAFRFAWLLYVSTHGDFQLGPIMYIPGEGWGVFWKLLIPPISE